MSDADLKRVQADLALVKGFCAEPAIPREDVGWLLATAAFGAAFALAAWSLPLVWVRLGALLFVVAGTVVYLPRKMRLLKRRTPDRALEAREYWIWGITSAALIAYVLYSRLVGPQLGLFEAQPWQQDAGTLFVFLGIGLVAGALVHRTRRPNLAMAVCMIAAGVLIPFAPSTAIGYVILGATLAVGSAGTAIGLEYLARGQRSDHAAD